MSDVVQISSERVDDIPLIVEWLKQMDIVKWIDQKLSQPHGNRKGLSYGQLSVLLLTQYRSVKENFLSLAHERMQNPARQARPMRTYPNSIEGCLPQPIVAKWNQIGCNSVILHANYADLEEHSRYFV